MTATARLIVMMEPDEKAALEAEADVANVSTAEFVRRRLLGRGEPEEQAFLQTLAALKPIVRKACKTIDANLAAIRALRENGDARDAQVARQARGELTRQERASIADRLDLRSAARRRGTRP